ncbi:nuclease-related domain-containing protein [Oligoflexus tunisiensis]|uniref:nuclease-related domain-containing protein n=1 Tax=Oligoflexus tunisiensis TaxID=708132 RepID=UPI00159EFC8D|nr:nuclease-related domain-containing protein [Oligoflexus tunisiensis]
MLAQKLKWIRLAQTQFQMIASDQAGSLGEQLAMGQLKRVMKKLGGRARVFPSLRVPKHRGNGKFEIDLLLVSERGLLAIEVKHWGGRLSRQKGKWLQERGPEKKTLTDPVPLNAEKVASLQRWLIARKIVLPPQSIHSVVLLTNPQVNVSPELKECVELVDTAAFEAFALARCGQARRGFWQKKPEAPFDFAALVRELEQLPTWDRLVLHGGQVVPGDLEYMAVPEVKASALQRKYLCHARVRICRRVFPGIFLKARLQVTDWSGQRRVYPLHPEAKLVFRPAGQNERTEVAWLHVESLQLGWKDQSYYNERY